MLSCSLYIFIQDRIRFASENETFMRILNYMNLNYIHFLEVFFKRKGIVNLKNQLHSYLLKFNFMK